MNRTITNLLSPRAPINPRHYIKIFAWISIGALTCSIFSNALLPVLISAALIAWLIRNGDLVEDPGVSPSHRRTHGNFGRLGERRFAFAA